MAEFGSVEWCTAILVEILVFAYLMGESGEDGGDEDQIIFK